MPHSNDSPKVEELKREAERSRAELAQTVHLLRDVVSDATADLNEKIAPGTIKANIGDYVRTRGEQMLDVARQNPLQTAAVGVIAAYPALALTRRIPAPLIMIGAGLFLMSSETGRNLSQKATEGAGDLAEMGQRAAHDLRDKSVDALAGVAEQASSVGASIRSSVSETTRAAGQYAAQTRATVTDGMADSQRSISEAADGLASRVRDLGENVSLQKFAGATADALANWARKNPLTAAAIGMAAGGLVANALPVTRAEARLAETASGDLRRRLGDALDQGVTTATGVMDQLTERTSQQGLTPQAIAEAARDYGERALKVAEATADAALSRADERNDSHSPAGG